MSKCESRVKQIGNHVTTGNYNNPQRGRVYDTSGIAPACNCCEGGGRETQILVSNIEQMVVASRRRDIEGGTEQKLEPNLEGISNSLTTVEKDNYVMEKELKIIQTPRGFNAGGIYEDCPSITTSAFQENNFVLNAINSFKLRIRKLIPKEYFRLMGFTDEDHDKCVAVGVSDSQLYRQAGNSIVTNCISLIFEHLYKAQYDNDYKCFDERILELLEGEKGSI